jgi:hypothetical protein
MPVVDGRDNKGCACAATYGLLRPFCSHSIPKSSLKVARRNSVLPKKSPSVQLGAVVIMSRRERNSLGSGDATAVRFAYSRNFLMKRAGIDQGQHRSWQYDLMS